MDSIAKPVPVVSEELQKYLDASNLHWVLCGGLCVGDYVQPKAWRLRDKDESIRMKQRTKDLQRLANLMRYLCATIPYLPAELQEKVNNFISHSND